ncbi:hypothetical protein HJC23_003439 [Cyclotella cryptica]|uniref:HMG box domain-containing protein n=1 Tax=Cyclotella cryptica TaxID=29204 RepID=A0ABD3QSL3_9STRA|eukprot:CCRYP_002578-RA/>CCRYP_002578-RA protein AED:0.00 eAED:0.00 QI:230/1/1/1/1/1/2/240/262
MARGPNQKAVAAAEKKAATQAVKDAEKTRQNEAREAAEWKQGANQRATSKAEEAAAKADEAARKKREKAALLAAEEEAMGSGKTIKSKFGAASNKKAGGKKKDDLSLLEDALVSDAEKKNKEKKRLERIKKEREAQLALEREQKQKEEQAKRDPLLANTDAMIGMDGPDDEGVGVAVGRKANVASMEDVQASGLDAAISALSVGGGDDRHPEKRMKAAYKAYEEKMMPEMKAQYPGLKRQQYLDKIFALWKKSPENPLNQQS